LNPAILYFTLKASETSKTVITMVRHPMRSPIKKYSSFKFLFIVIFMLIHYVSAAQDNYLVTTRGDTVKGELKLLFYGPEKKVQVKNAEGKTLYSILHTKSFFYENETYLPAKGPYGYAFMKLLKPGYMSLLAFQVDKATTYDGRFLLKGDGKGLEVPNLGFKKQLARFLADCEAISLKIEQDVYSKKDLETIVDEYNQCIAGKTIAVEQVIVKEKETHTKSNSWDSLIEQINQHADFEGKSTALEMTADIKSRVQRGEKVPNFVIDGLKSTLSQQADLKETLEKALAEIGY
jgi:hypothetical protein